MSNILALPVDYVPIHANSSLFSSVRQRRPPTEDDWQHNEFSFEPFVKRELKIRLDTGTWCSDIDDEVCPRYKKGHCELQSRCPLRHVVTPSPPVPVLGRDAMRRTVCKHWLRGLCKKGDACDYLHEYDLRRMAECRFYSTFGFCNSGDECLYVHIDPSVKRRECELYKRGFCPRGTCFSHTQGHSAPRNTCCRWPVPTTLPVSVLRAPNAIWDSTCRADAVSKPWLRRPSRAPPRRSLLTALFPSWKHSAWAPASTNSPQTRARAARLCPSPTGPQPKSCARRRWPARHAILAAANSTRSCATSAANMDTLRMRACTLPGQPPGASWTVEVAGGSL